MGAIENKKILKYCPDYYKIINQEFDESDIVAVKLLQIFQEYIFTIDTESKSDIKLVTDLSASINKYFEDAEFKKELVGTISSLKVNKNASNLLRSIAEEIVKCHKKYLEYYTRNLYIPRWI